MSRSFQMLETRIPPLLVALLFANLMLVLTELNTLPIARSLYTSALAALCLCASIVLMGLSILALRQAKTTLDPHHPEHSSHLVQVGVYRFTRNPIYGGLLLLLLAWGFLLADGLALVSVYLFVAYMNRFQIRPEETALEAHFGSDYLLYCARVNRWFFQPRKTL